MATYTYAVLELSPAAYKEISEKLKAAGGRHAFQNGPGGEVIDLNGVSIRKEPTVAELREELELSGEIDPLELPKPSPVQLGDRSGALARNAARRAGIEITTQTKPVRELTHRERFPNPREIKVRVPACQETDISKVLSIEPGHAWRDPAQKPGPTQEEPIVTHPPVPAPPPPLPQDGVRIAVKNDDGQVLALDLNDGDGFNLPGGVIADGETPRKAAARLLESQMGLETDDLIEVYSGPDDKFRKSHAFIVLADNDIKVQSEEGTAEFVKIPELLCGQWGVFVRDALNAAGWMNRPKMDLAKLYHVCQLAIRNGSHRAQKGVDMVIDEITFLTDIGKLYVVDNMLGTIDVAQLHPDVAHTLLVMVEPLEGLQNKAKVEQDVEILLEAIDGPRTPIRFGEHSDIRKTARKYYRQKAAEFGKMLRDGTLAQKFGGRHRGGPALRKDVPDDAPWPPPDVKDTN